MYVGKDEVLDFSDKIIQFIEMNNLQNDYGNLIIDYVEGLYLHGYPVLGLDVEKQVYVFYNYINVYNSLLLNFGEDEFIEYIIALELTKNTY